MHSEFIFETIFTPCATPRRFIEILSYSFRGKYVYSVNSS